MSTCHFYFYCILKIGHFLSNGWGWMIFWCLRDLEATDYDKILKYRDVLAVELTELTKLSYVRKNFSELVSGSHKVLFVEETSFSGIFVILNHIFIILLCITLSKFFLLNLQSQKHILHTMVHN